MDILAADCSLIDSLEQYGDTGTYVVIDDDLHVDLRRHSRWSMRRAVAERSLPIPSTGRGSAPTNPCPMRIGHGYSIASGSSTTRGAIRTSLVRLNQFWSIPRHYQGQRRRRRHPEWRFLIMSGLRASVGGRSAWSLPSYNRRRRSANGPARVIAAEIARLVDTIPTNAQDHSRGLHVDTSRIIIGHDASDRGLLGHLSKVASSIPGGQVPHHVRDPNVQCQGSRQASCRAGTASVFETSIRNTGYRAAKATITSGSEEKPKNRTPPGT